MCMHRIFVCLSKSNFTWSVFVSLSLYHSFFFLFLSGGELFQCKQFTFLTNLLFSFCLSVFFSFFSLLFYFHCLYPSSTQFKQWGNTTLQKIIFIIYWYTYCVVIDIVLPSNFFSLLIFMRKQSSSSLSSSNLSLFFFSSNNKWTNKSYEVSCFILCAKKKPTGFIDLLDWQCVWVCGLHRYW